jgi:predicted LPLAT superfamily acyltransferase
MASVTGAPIGVLLSAKSGSESYELRLAKTLRVPGGLGRGGRAFADYARQFAETLEDYTRQYPYQFFNFFDMWEPLVAADPPADKE